MARRRIRRWWRPVGGLGAVADDVGQGGLHDGVRGLGAFGGPVAERRAESVRHGVDAGRADHVAERGDRQRASGRRGGEHERSEADRGRLAQHLERAAGERHAVLAAGLHAHRGDRKALTRVYQALPETDLAISAPLARTLRLIDHVGVPEPHHAQPAATPGLTIPQWHMLYGPSGNVPREVLTRHALVLGETGSGKTASAILPVLAAMARAPCERLGGGLIIDPKHDLAPRLARLAPHRLHHIACEDIVLDVMGAQSSRLDADLAAHRWVSAARRILLRMSSFVPGSALRVMRPHQRAGGHAEFFDQEGTRFLTDVLAFILMVTAPPHASCGRGHFDGSSCARTPRATAKRMARYGTS